MERLSVGKSSMVASCPVDLPDVDRITTPPPVSAGCHSTCFNDVSYPSTASLYLLPCYLLFVFLLLPKRAGLPLVSILQIRHV